MNFSINGQTVSLSGFRVMGVSGRETIKHEILSHEVSAVNGAHYHGKRIAPRTIGVHFQLIVSSRFAWWDKTYNALSAATNGEEVKLIFDDEPDKYWIGTRSELKLDKKIVNGFVYGHISFTCSDPYKYRTYTVNAEQNADGSITFHNEGNVSAPAFYTITHHDTPYGETENGFLGIVSTDGAIQIGDDSYTVTQTDRVNLQAPTLNLLVTSENNHDNTFDNGGTGKLTSFQNRDFFTMDARPSSSTNTWRGVSTMVTLTDRTDTFTVASDISFFAGKPTQKGVIQLVLLDINKERIAKWNISKGYDSYARLEGGPAGYKERLDCKFIPMAGTYGDSRTKTVVKIVKNGSNFKFVIANNNSTDAWEYVCPDLESKELKYISMFIGAYEDVEMITEAGFGHLQVVSSDKQGTFEDGEIVTVDGESTLVRRNDVICDDEIIGSTYFRIPPGEFTVHLLSSAYYHGTIDFTGYIRERWE